MKYDEFVYVKDGKTSLVKVKDCTSKDLENMEREGELRCPGKECEAKLCLVHNFKSGGRTYFLKAVDDEKHHPDCDYKIDNYKEISVSISKNGFFTENQINDAARRIYRDYTRPIEPNEEGKSKKNRKKQTGTKKGVAEEGTKVKQTAFSGRIIYGEESADGVKGIVRRGYNITMDDFGKMKAICGSVEDIIYNLDGEMFIKFKEERLNNIQVYIGPIYKYNNPTEYESLHLVKDYFEKNYKWKDIIVGVAGMVNKHKEMLVLELQANGSFIVDGQTIMKMVYENAKKRIKKE